MSMSGKTVTCKVDGARRLKCARLHSAGHMIDVSMSRLGLLEGLIATKGYHFDDGPYVEFKGDMSKETMDTLPAKLSEQLAFLVAEDIPTEVEMMSREQAEEACGCDTSTYPAKVRVVKVAGMPCPCGGTHVPSTAMVGKVTVTKIKKKKDVIKVSYILD